MAGRNGVPGSDGELTVYSPNIEEHGGCIHPNVSGSRPRRPGKWRVIYVNGMATTSRVHATTSRQLATIAGTHVSGIYNQCGTDGTTGIKSFLADLWQCARDQTLPVGRTIDWRIRRLLNMTPAAAADAIGNYLLRNNLAAQTLYTELLQAARTGRPTIVVCHSQGNLITTNALWVLKHIRRETKTKMGNIRVFGLASPSVSWPPNNKDGLALKLYRHSGDPVTLLSFPWIGQKAATVQAPTHTHTTIGPHGLPMTYTTSELSFKYHDVTTYYFMREDFQRDLFSTLRS